MEIPTSENIFAADIPDRLEKASRNKKGATITKNVKIKCALETYMPFLCLFTDSL